MVFSTVPDCEIDGVGLEAPEAGCVPVGYGHFFYVDVFGGGLGLEFGGERVDEFVEALTGFVVDEDGVGEDGVFGGGLAAVDFALWGYGAFGFSGVDFVGCQLFFGDWILCGHCDHIMRDGVGGWKVMLLILFRKIVVTEFLD